MKDIPVYNKSNPGSKDFSVELLNQFKSGHPIQINRNNYDEYKQSDLTGYISDLYKSLEKEALTKDKIDFFRSQYLLFKDTYDVHLRWEVYERFVDFLISQNKIEEAITEWERLQEEEWDGWSIQFSYRDQAIDRLIEFEQKLNNGIINGYHIHKIAPKGNQLTTFGKRNKSDVLLVVDTIINSSEHESFFNFFYKNYSFNLNGRKITFPFEYYEQFFLDTTNGRKSLECFKTKEGKTFGNAITKDGKATQSFVRLAIRNKASSLLREAENEYRINIGAKKVGESWISETELFYKIKNALPHLKVIHHGSPGWLGRQHFDIWIPEINCAVEFQGQQHDKPINFFGGEEAFKKNKKRDLLKKKKASSNSVALIEVRQGYKIEDVLRTIKSTANKT